VAATEAENKSKRHVDQLPSMLMAIEQCVMAGTVDAPDALNYLLEAITITDGLDGAAVALISNDQLLCTASNGKALTTGSVLDRESGPFAECMSEGRMVHLQPGSKTFLQGSEYQTTVCRSGMLLPLHVAGHYCGVLAVFSSTLERLGNRHIVVLGTAATIASLLTARCPQVGTPHMSAPTTRPPLESSLGDRIRNQQRHSTKLIWWVSCVVAALALSGALFGSKALLSARGQLRSDIAGRGSLPYTIDEHVGHASATALEQGTRGDGEFSGGQLRVRIKPDYPAMALREVRQGKVTGTILVNRAGVVEEVKILSGDPVLAAAVQSAVGHWRYAPFLLSNQTVAVAIPLEVTFRIEPSRKSVTQ